MDVPVAFTLQHDHACSFLAGTTWLDMMNLHIRWIEENKGALQNDWISYEEKGGVEMPRGMWVIVSRCQTRLSRMKSHIGIYGSGRAVSE